MATSFSSSPSSAISLTSPDVLLEVAPIFAKVKAESAGSDDSKYRMPMKGGFLLFEKHHPPQRLLPLIKQIASLSELQPDWDSYGARTINPMCIAASVQLALRIVGDQSPIPHAGPTVRGGVQMEWHRNNIDFEIEITSPTEISAFFSDDNSHEEVEFEVAGDLNRVEMYLERLK